jgi:hypothetical protein
VKPAWFRPWFIEPTTTITGGLASALGVLPEEAAGQQWRSVGSSVASNRPAAVGKPTHHGFSSSSSRPGSRPAHIWESRLQIVRLSVHGSPGLAGVAAQWTADTVTSWHGRSGGTRSASATSTIFRTKMAADPEGRGRPTDRLPVSENEGASRRAKTSLDGAVSGAPLGHREANDRVELRRSKAHCRRRRGVSATLQPCGRF